jgi:uncharacterized Tic20 family protein
MNISEELQKLQQLHQSGAISDEEFAKAKARLLEGSAAPPLIDTGVVGMGDPHARLAEKTRQWAMFLHLSLLAGHLVPYAGLVLPIVIWQMKKSEMPGLDAHGKNVVNWIISFVTYSAICGLLFFIVIGIPLLIALGVIGLIFPIIAALKASNGEVWKYPLSFTILK